MAHNKRLLLNSSAALFAKILSGPDKGFFILEHYSFRFKKKKCKKLGLIDGEEDDNSAVQEPMLIGSCAVIMVVILPSSLTQITPFPFF